MTEKIILNVSDELAEQIEAVYEERQQNAVESMQAHGWDKQAEKIENTDVASNTADKALFVLRQEVEG
jgi:hypothetical protein